MPPMPRELGPHRDPPTVQDFRFPSPHQRLELDRRPLTESATRRLRREFFRLLVGDERLDEVKEHDKFLYGKGATVKIGKTRVSFFDTSGWESLGYHHRAKKHPVVVVTERRRGLRRRIVIRNPQRIIRYEHTSRITGSKGKKKLEVYVSHETGKVVTF